jgi:MFS family permease
MRVPSNQPDRPDDPETSPPRGALAGHADDLLGAGHLTRTFRSLAHRNYRIYFYAQVVSLCGTWMQSVALMLAGRLSSRALPRSIGFAQLGFAVTLAAFAFSSNFYISLALIVACGFCMTFQLSGGQSLLQTLVPDRLRGRACSIWTMTILGPSPLGSLLVGSAASHWGAPRALAVCAGVTFISACVYLLVETRGQAS